MINLLGIFLVITSIVSAGVWSPPPPAKTGDVIVKEGHRVVVVEYDEDGQRNTKVSIWSEHDNLQRSPSMEEKISSAASDVLENTREKIKEASSVLPNLGKGISMEEYNPEELICDAYDVCSDKVTGAVVKAKDSVSEKAQKAGDLIGRAKEAASHKAHDIKEGVKEGAKESFSKVKETATETTGEVKDSAKKSLSKAKDSVKEVRDMGRTVGKDVAHNVTKQVTRVRDSVVKETEKPKNGLKQGFGVLIGLMRYLGLSDAVDSLMGVMNLMGFAVAYGTSVWVTFVSSYVLAKVLPRQQFGIVQSKIYPVYFRAMATSIGLAFLGHTARLFRNKADMLQAANLLGSVLMVLANSLYLEPRATKVMFERMKVEREEGRGREGIVGESSRATTQTRTTEENDHVATTTTKVTRPQESPELEAVRSKLTRLSERLKKLNSYSLLLNILTLMSLSWHLVYLAQRLHMVS